MIMAKAVLPLQIDLQPRQLELKLLKQFGMSAFDVLISQFGLLGCVCR